eukprot:scaffold265964_cov30-Tisochrysis_lutea.AAC.1
MSGRGRGRGRGGMPISYPDGVLCKPYDVRRYPPLAPPFGYFGRGTLPAHPGVLPAEAGALDVWRRLRQHPASFESRIPEVQQQADIERYSDRYTASATPSTMFVKSSYCRMTRGMHYPAELNPAKAKAKGSKRSRSSTGDMFQGVTWAAEDELEVLEAAAQAEEGEGSGSEAEDEEGRKRKDAGRYDDAEPKEEGEEGDKDDDDDLDDDEEEEEDDILGEDGGFAYGEGFEDGDDDIDSGGEDEPTY